MDARRTTASPRVPRSRGGGSAHALPKIEDGDASAAGPSTARRGSRREYQDASEINYTPEKAHKASSKMTEEVEETLKTLTLSRGDHWKTRIAELQAKLKDKPTTLIGVCGATGAGKSSLLNAVLDDNIVPTSGMRACTAVVTKISHHKFRKEPHPKSREILAEIYFLSEAEWRQEIKVLAGDWASRLDDGKVTEEAKIAWDKFHAVYPELEENDLEGMTEQDLIEYDPRVTAKLGQVETVIASDSEAFRKKIARYIDSVSRDDPMSLSMGDDEDENANLAYWPLIREVHVFCRSKALSTGAVLVDLPGVADANAARANKAKEYLKDAKHIWILAPITRAVDDQTAQNLLGDAFQKERYNGSYEHITFVASKTDDVAATEIVRALGLSRDPVYRAIQSRTREVDKRWTAIEQRKNNVAKMFSGERVGWFVQELETDDLFGDSYATEATANRDDLKQTRESWNSRLLGLETASVAMWATLPSASSSTAAGTKRKAKLPCDGKPGPSKSRRRRKKSADYSDSSSDSDSDSRDELDFSESDQDAEYEEVTPDLEEINDSSVLRRKIQEIDQEIAELEGRIAGLAADGKAILEEKAVLDQEKSDAQQAKNAFCSLKRNEASKERLKEDFRVGFRKLEEMEAEKRDGAAFDPTQNTRDYDAIDLPVFTCSGRDYMRLKGQAEGDGAANCFSSVEDTEIPDLQEHCHTLTLASRRIFVKDVLNTLSNLATAVEMYAKHVQIPGAAAAAHRMQLAYRWDSNKVHVHGCVSVTQRLRKEFSDLASKCADDLNKTFKNGLEEKCLDGAKVASESAIEIIEKFGAIHHATYRATMKRNGSWRRDVNLELVDPFTQTIAKSFSAMFEKDIFGPLEVSIRNCIAQLMVEFIDSAADELKTGANLQQKACRKEIRATLDRTMEAVKETMSTQRKEISRSVAPHIKECLMESYENARKEKGKGSVARAHFRAYVEQQKDTMFSEAANTILIGLENAAGAVGNTLRDTLFELAEKVEVNLAVIWEDVRSGQEEINARAHALQVMRRVMTQTELWLVAARRDEGRLAIEQGENEDVDMH